MSNKDVIRLTMKNFVDGSAHNTIVHVMERIADEIAFMSEDIIPVDTGNLQDSTGIALYHGDVLRKYIPTQTAKKANEGLWGTVELEKAITYGAMKFSNDYYLVLFSAMPYAGYNSGDNGEFFRVITSDVLGIAMSIFNSIK